MDAVTIQPEAYLFESKSISNMRGVQLNPDLSCVSTDSTVYPLVKLELLEELKEELILAFEEERERADEEGYQLNIDDCIDVIRAAYDKFKEHHS